MLLLSVYAGTECFTNCVLQTLTGLTMYLTRLVRTTTAHRPSAMARRELLLLTWLKRLRQASLSPVRRGMQYLGAAHACACD